MNVLVQSASPDQRYIGLFPPEYAESQLTKLVISETLDMKNLLLLTFPKTCREGVKREKWGKL